jgi:hypothetical protein
MSAEVAGSDLRFFRNGADYEPYRQEDYQRVMGADGEYWKLGNLGPDLETDELLRAKGKKEVNASVTLNLNPQIITKF